MIEREFDIAFIADLALREKQIQQNYRPIIAVHKWFARRPGTLFRGLLLSEFGSGPLQECFYKSNNLKGIQIADPFMGGGTPLLEANRMGCDINGMDINPMAYWIVREEIESIDLDLYKREAEILRAKLATSVGKLYETECRHCGSSNANVKYFLWVKTYECQSCGRDVDLFPGYLLAENRRHPQNVLVCGCCGELCECEDAQHPGNCQVCKTPLILSGPAARNQCRCPNCNVICKYPRKGLGPPRHRMFAIEYYCVNCKSKHLGRFFKKPDQSDLEKFTQAEVARQNLKGDFIPEDHIPRGDETDRLLRWGYERYAQMFNARQLFGLELSCDLISKQPHERVRRALATNLSDLLRYQNMLCRYDSMALKSLDIFSVHGFPVGLMQCESNLLGITNGTSETSVGSGGWSNIVSKYAKAKEYCDHPFEVRHHAGRKTIVPIAGEWIGDAKNEKSSPESRKVNLQCGNAGLMKLLPASLDAVFTDPPYFGNVQYAELMDFCYVWLRRLAGLQEPSFSEVSTRNHGELTGNVSMNRGLEHFTEGLSAVFQTMARALKPGAPLAFTYHHNKIDAYYPVAVAILDAGLACSSSIPCPAEMGASIHISGTKSSILDTVFVCRATGKMQRQLLAQEPEMIASLVRSDLEKLSRGGVKPTSGDTLCIAYGHLIRLAVWNLRKVWIKDTPTPEKLAAVARYIDHLGGVTALRGCLLGPSSDEKLLRLESVRV